MMYANNQDSAKNLSQLSYIDEMKGLVCQQQ
jgi:hypothetical protein